MVEQRALSWCFCCNCLSPTEEQSFWDSKRKLASEEFSINILWNNYQVWFVYIVKVLWRSLGASYGCECCFNVTVLSLKLKQTGDCWNCGGLERILYQHKFQEEVTLMLTAFSSRALNVTVVNKQLQEAGLIRSQPSCGGSPSVGDSGWAGELRVKRSVSIETTRLK